jgi:hypothetical protein
MVHGVHLPIYRTVSYMYRTYLPCGSDVLQASVADDASQIKADCRVHRRDHGNPLQGGRVDTSRWSH